jgi:hypothetical protein
MQKVPHRGDREPAFEDVFVEHVVSVVMRVQSKWGIGSFRKNDKSVLPFEVDC